MELYVVERCGRTAGYFILASAGSQVRLADCWVNSTEQADWTAMIGCAIGEARRVIGAIELAAWANDPFLMSALQANGFRARFSMPIFIRGGPRGMADAVLRIQMIDNDAVYLQADRSELWA
jgi:hypothetical protein